ncbi:MAG: phosphatidate cytidylyltransferase [Lachnospiraceae bacterium]|nr:phosphatidate cytidylyltransferase [Lachnospiraceae bacterium]
MFGKRLLSSIVLVLLALGVLIPGGPLLAAALFLLSLTAYHELQTACGLSKKAPEIAGYAAVLAFYAVMFFVPDRNYLLITVFLSLSAFMTLYVLTFPKYGAKEIMMSVFNLVYAPFMMSFIYMTRELECGIYAVWMIFISSWICDTCAYCVGILLGKHPLTPVLSPKKTVEGALGGIFGSALIGFLFAYFVIMPSDIAISKTAATPFVFAGISAAGAVISQIGDLAASGIKRDMEIKDYGKLIPGHGGVMDRFDSVVFTAPVIYFLTLLFIG